jgi:hypothetical protein
LDNLIMKVENELSDLNNNNNYNQENNYWINKIIIKQ